MRLCFYLLCFRRTGKRYFVHFPLNRYCLVKKVFGHVCTFSLFYLIMKPPNKKMRVGWILVCMWLQVRRMNFNMDKPFTLTAAYDSDAELPTSFTPKIGTFKVLLYPFRGIFFSCAPFKWHVRGVCFCCSFAIRLNGL